MTLSLTLPAEVWQTLYAVMMDEPVRFAVRRAVVQQFEAAVRDAQQTAPPKDGD